MMIFQPQVPQIHQIRPSQWAFSIGGRVAHPLILSFWDLLALPAVEQRSAIAAWAGSAGDQAPLIEEANWRGVTFETLLAAVDSAPDVRYATIHASGRYSTILTLDQLRRALLAYDKDDAMLAANDGFPARLVAPGLAAYKQPKWVERVELTAEPTGGFWEQRGEAVASPGAFDEALAPTIAQIDHMQERASAGRPVTIAGRAFAGERAVAHVEISIDDGPWAALRVEQPLRTATARWSVAWTPPGPGAYALRARAIDAAGDVSPAHTVIVHVDG
ncbi:MAG: molybdopterin-dependent oxidoreductase [Chloroflexi bacterium]|nr:molybdopterin-dependent oxidoreductase [Chloroflexota bacterium]